MVGYGIYRVNTNDYSLSSKCSMDEAGSVLMVIFLKKHANVLTEINRKKNQFLH